jgi:general stress protein 26
MGTTKSLDDNAAIEKIKELTKGKIGLLCTIQNGEIESRPMSTQGVDDDGTMWFFSHRDSHKNQQIENVDKVYLMYSDQDKHHYLSLAGYAEVVVDKAKIEEYWNPFVKAWFEGGKDDPAITLLKVTPVDGHYWDTKDGKLVTLIKIAVASLTGSHKDGSVEGDLNL